MAAAATADSTPWLTEARKLVGLREIIGSKHEAKILQFFAEAGHPNIRDDETSWCAAFANAMLVRSGWAGTGSLLARSFLTWGTALDGPKVGAIVVFRRGKEPWQGHVAIVVGEGIDTVRVLGGNQGNAVNIISMPKADVLGYRWPLIKASAPVAKSSPKKEAAKVGTGAAGGAVVVGTGAAAVDAGWSWIEIAMAVGGVVLVAVLAWRLWLAWGEWKKGRAELAADAELVAPPPTSDPAGIAEDARSAIISDLKNHIEEINQKASKAKAVAPKTRRKGINPKRPAAKPKPTKPKPAAKKRRA